MQPVHSEIMSGGASHVREHGDAAAPQNEVAIRGDRAVGGLGNNLHSIVGSRKAGKLAAPCEAFCLKAGKNRAE